MITLEEAASRARRHAELSGSVLLHELTQEHSFGWIFFYGDRDGGVLAGNAPLLVERETGRLFTTGTAFPTRHYIDRYLETGDPHGEISRRVVIRAKSGDVDKLSTVQAIRDIGEVGVAVAGAFVERLAQNEEVVVETRSAEAAGNLVARLESLGWSAQRFYGNKD